MLIQYDPYTTRAIIITHLPCVLNRSPTNFGANNTNANTCNTTSTNVDNRTCLRHSMKFRQRVRTLRLHSDAMFDFVPLAAKNALRTQAVREASKSVGALLYGRPDMCNYKQRQYSIVDLGKYLHIISAVLIPCELTNTMASVYIRFTTAWPYTSYNSIVRSSSKAYVVLSIYI